MKKVDFLNELYHYIRTLPRDEKNRIMDDFRERFREGELAGKTEQQICYELGSPLDCARQYMGDILFVKKIKTEPKKKNHKAFWTVVFFWNLVQAFFSVPITLGLFTVAGIMIFTYCFIVPMIGSVALLVFAIASTSTVLCLAIITLLWTIFQIKECVVRMNKEE